jgi:hypothetical protein
LEEKCSPFTESSTDEFPATVAGIAHVTNPALCTVASTTVRDEKRHCALGTVTSGLKWTNKTSPPCLCVAVLALLTGTTLGVYKKADAKDVVFACVMEPEYEITSDDKPLDAAGAMQ